MRRELMFLAGCLTVVLGFATAASAQPPLEVTDAVPAVLPGVAVNVPVPPVEEPVQTTAPQPPAIPPARAFIYSDGYRLRAKIHRVSSFATLPLFGVQAFLGQSLYSNPSGGKKDAHLVVAGGIGGLFAVNTVTGVWNMLEARKDPNRGKRRLIHGLMMLGADAGFLATAALGPDSEGGGSRSTHRAVAFTSIGLATASYLIMLIGGR